jgi:molybdopterin-guanine dinucleotide biosynthesis protein A
MYLWSQEEVMFDMHCVIFAGGKSSRMGTDKALLPFGGCDTLLEYQYERMKKIFKNVSISVKSSKKVESVSKEHVSYNVIEDAKGSGVFAPTAGFVAMFKALDDEKFFVLSVDTPFISKVEIASLIDADCEDIDATIAKTKTGMHPMCGVYHRSLEESFQHMLKEDNHRLGKLLKVSKTKYVTFEDDRAFSNLNHPHEYDRALLLYKK